LVEQRGQFPFGKRLVSLNEETNFGDKKDGFREPKEPSNPGSKTKTKTKTKPDHL